MTHPRRIGARYLCTWSNHAASREVGAQLDASRQNLDRLDMFQPLSVPAEERASFVAKILTPPTAGAPMMVYDKGENFQTLHRDNASPAGYQKIFAMIQSGGHASGRKGHFSASLQAGWTELHVYGTSRVCFCSPARPKLVGVREFSLRLTPLPLCLTPVGGDCDF